MWREDAGVDRRRGADAPRRHRDSGRRRWAAATAACWAAATAAVHACPICFQTEDAQAGAGVRAAVLVLGGVTVVVLGAIGVFAHRVARRDRP